MDPSPPGSPAEAILGERATEQAVAEAREQYGLDDPIYIQYVRYLQSLAEGDLGASAYSHRLVTDEIRERFPATIELALMAMLFAIAVGVPLGFYAAKRHGGAFDHFSLFASLIGVSIPIFFLAILLKYGFAVKLEWLPSVGRQDVLITAEHPTNFYVLDGIITGNWNAAWDATKHLILPAIALGSIPLAIIARITRASVLDVQNEDYVRTARAKGLPPTHCRPGPCLSQRDAARCHRDRPPGRPIAFGSDSHRDGIRVPGNGHLGAGGDQAPRLPGSPGRDPLHRGRRRPHQPLR